MPGKISNNKCARGFDHEMDPDLTRKSKTHIQQTCKKCKGKFYKARRN